MLSYLVVGFFAGLHRACWGAYKDSPFENFNKYSFFRSLILAPAWALAFYWFFPFLGIERQTYQLLHVFLITVVFDTVSLEFYKLFFRRESQAVYKIPSRFNILGKKVSNDRRAILGVTFSIGFLALFWFLTRFDLTLNHLFYFVLVGFFGGFLMGMVEAVGGSWKDAPFEGFDRLKFFRSPLISAFWGLLLVFGQQNLGLLVFSAVGATRMTVEVHKAFLKGYRSGKFKATKPTFSYWAEHREWFYPPYVLTWLVFIGLLISSLISA